MVTNLRSLLRIPVIALSAFLLICGCASVREIAPEEKPLAYVAEGRRNADAARRFAPIFLVHSAKAEYNRIGTPSAKAVGEEEKVYVDAASPSIYWESRDFSTERGQYTNLIYRVHYPETPGNIYPFMLTSGSNMGHLVVITLDRLSGAPLLVSQTHTCGCYLAMMATDYLLPAMRPVDWNEGRQEKYGESLPSLLPFKTTVEPRLLFEVRPGDHRVMDVKVVSDAENAQPLGGALWTEASLLPMSALKALPINGRTTSFYDDSGFVKGSWKPWETLFMGWWALDLRVGSDKEYGNPENRFYTSLKFWARSESDMNDFPVFLNYWGWRL